MSTHRASGIYRASMTAAALMLAAAVTPGAGAAAAQAATGATAAPARAPAHPAPAAGGTITTLAGGPGGPGPATKVAVALPRGVSFAGGHLYISDGYVREVSLVTGWLTTPVGVVPGALPGDGGPASQASVAANTTASDKKGNLVIADGSNRIRVVAASTGTFYGQRMTAKDIYTVAGDGTAGFSGDGGPATQAELSIPGAVAVDSHGNLVIADSGNDRVRVVARHTGSFYGQPMTAGDIYTVAGTGMTGLSGDGGPATSAAIDSVQGVALDAAGNLLITDAQSLDGRVRAVAEHTGSFYGQPMTAGDIYTIVGGGNDGLTDGIPATQCFLYGPGGLTVDSSGNVVIADSSFSTVRVLAVRTGTFYGQPMTAGDIYTVAGNGTHGPGDHLFSLRSVAFDSAGNLLIADTMNSRVAVLAASSGTFYGQAMTAGNVYTIAGNGTEGSSGGGGPATRAEIAAEGVALDHAGNILVSDSAQGANLLRVIPPRSGTFYGQAMTAGHIYAIAGGGSSYPGDGGPATSGELSHPQGLAVDSTGNILIADAFGNRVRMVAERTGTFYGQPMTAGDIYTVAGDGLFYYKGDGGPATSAGIQPWSVALDGQGNLVIADEGNNRVHVVAASTGTFYGQAMTAGYIYTVAGDGRTRYNGTAIPATEAAVHGPLGVAVDSAGNLLIGEGRDNRVRVVAEHTGTFYGRAMTAGDIYAVVGNGTAGFSGDGGAATMAEVNDPGGISVDQAGNVLISDIVNNRVRVVAERTGTFYGRAMTAGHIYTVAGGGTGGLGDGGPATSAELAYPQAVATEANGSLLIAGGGRVRLVAG